MSMPNVGVTQVIEQPGIGNVLARNISGLAQALMARQQAEQERLKNEAYNAYMAELTKASQERRDLERQQAAQDQMDQRDLGTMFTQYMTPRQVTQGVPTFGGQVLPGFQVQGEQQRSLADVLQQSERPELASQFATAVKPYEDTRIKEAAARRAATAMQRMLSDPKVPEAVRRQAALWNNLKDTDLPDYAKNEFVRRAEAEAGDDDKGKARAYYRRLFPQLSDAPDAVVDDHGSRLMRIRLGAETGAAGGGTGGTAPVNGKRAAAYEAELIKIQIELDRETEKIDGDRNVRDKNAAKTRAEARAALRQKQARLKYGVPEPVEPPPAPRDTRLPFFMR